MRQTLGPAKQQKSKQSGGALVPKPAKITVLGGHTQIPETETVADVMWERSERLHQHQIVLFQTHC